MIKLKSNPYNYQRQLPHYQNPNCTLFVTFCKLLPDPLSGAARAIVVRHCLHDHGKKLAMHAAIVMPEHVHLLLTPLLDPQGRVYPLKHILKLIKGSSAHSVNESMGHHGPLWQEESFDHVLRSNESFAEKLEYIRQNPVRRGLVERPEDYPWLWVAG
jgi:REP element-mobilizing transposase RayT